MLADRDAGALARVREGHVLPLRAKGGRGLKRASHTEAAVGLMKLAGLEPVAMMAEMVNDDGTMMRREELFQASLRFGLPMTSISNLKDHLAKLSPKLNSSSNRVRCDAEAKVPTNHGDVRVRGY